MLSYDTYYRRKGDKEKEKEDVAGKASIMDNGQIDLSQLKKSVFVFDFSDSLNFTRRAASLHRTFKFIMIAQPLQ